VDFSGFITGLSEYTAVPLAGIVTYIIISIIRGFLLPRSYVESRISDKDSQITNLGRERDSWRESSQNSEIARAILVKQNSDLLDGAETTNRLMETMRLHIQNYPNPQKGHDHA